MEEKLYGVLCVEADGYQTICNVTYSSQSCSVGTKQACKAFIDDYSTMFPENTYKLFKLKFKEY